MLSDVLDPLQTVLAIVGLRLILLDELHMLSVLLKSFSVEIVYVLFQSLNLVKFGTVNNIVVVYGILR